MLILHLSDLHVTEARESLATTWLRVERALKAAATESFDFVVVSGDLSQRASPAEYDELLAFANDRLLRLLRKPDRARIVFVPGNHDVDWSVPVGDAFRLADRGADLAYVQAQLERYKAAPDLSDLRLEIGKYGHLDLIRLDPARYPERLRNVQAFFDAFYGDALSPAGRGFRLLDPSPTQHFSAHVFADEQVAFFGFSSLHRNDRYWTGASISSEAVAAAHELARRLPPGTQRVAVWHHGFSSERGRPDSLTLQDIGLLHAGGFRVGFHGHTHREALQLAELVQDRFAVISTGSFGAGSQDRPDAVGNQFSVVRLTPSSVSVDCYEKSGEAQVYRPGRRRYHELAQGPSRAPLFLHTRAGLHRRSWVVRKDGIARASVQLDAFTAEPDVPLAVLAQPFCSMLPDAQAVTPQGRISVRREARDDGRVAFLLQAGHQRTHASLSWKYHVSNALSLDRAELSLLEDRQRWYPNLPAGHDLCCHTVRFESDQLELSIEYEPDTSVRFAQLVPLVEQRVERAGELSWERSDTEEQRCVVSGEGEARATLRVLGPVVGKRYGLAFQLSREGEPYPEVLALDANEILRQCFGPEPGAAGSLSSRLGWATEAVIRGLFAERNIVEPRPVEQGEQSGLFGPRTTLMGMLWETSRRTLRPAFGRFWTQSWGARFACGEGVAGHAFRFAVPSAWHQDSAAAGHVSSILFQQYPQHHVYPRHYRWVLSVPLRATERSCIGCVTLASEEEQGTPAERQLARIARVTSTGMNDPSSVALRGDLERVVNLAFWSTVAGTEGLTGAAREHARTVLTRLGAPPEGEG